LNETRIGTRLGSNGEPERRKVKNRKGEKNHRTAEIKNERKKTKMTKKNSE
jgi:hypothetical protein